MRTNPRTLWQSAGVVLLVSALLLPGCGSKMPTKNRGKAASSATSSANKQSLAGKKILLVHSYHPEYPWVASVTEGVRTGLKGSGVQLKVFYMDTKRKTDKAWMVKAGQLATKEMLSYKPDAVIVCDDNAQQHFVMQHIGEKTPFIFTGVDADPSKYGFPASNATGVIERPHFRESLGLARRIRPIKRIAVLSCNDSTSVAALGFMKQDNIDVEVAEWKLATDFNDWKKAVDRFNNSVDAIVIRSYQAVVDPATGDKMKPADVVNWTVAHAKVPTIAFHDFEISDGMLMGVVKDGREYGQKPAAYALSLLSGTPIDSLPVIKASKGIPMINSLTAKRLGMAIDTDTLRDVRIVPER